MVSLSLVRRMNFAGVFLLPDEETILRFYRPQLCFWLAEYDEIFGELKCLRVRVRGSPEILRFGTGGNNLVHLFAPAAAQPHNRSVISKIDQATSIQQSEENHALSGGES